ncbi:hypothetical protein AbraIFM66951_009356, partial [Aspergillus brasiliensis]
IRSKVKSTGKKKWDEISNGNTTSSCTYSAKRVREDKVACQSPSPVGNLEKDPQPGPASEKRWVHNVL